MSVQFLICVISYGTRVVNDKIRKALLLFIHVAALFKYSHKLFGIPGIHLAPECGDMIGKASSRLFRTLSYDPGCLFNVFRLFLCILIVICHLLYTDVSVITMSVDMSVASVSIISATCISYANPITAPTSLFPKNLS